MIDRNVDTYTEFYKQGHIPQSVHFDLYRCAPKNPYIFLDIPDVNCFTDYVQSLGVWSDTHVVAYDRFGPRSAYKTWWLFRAFGHRNISVLDGGLRKWLEDGYEVTTDEPKIERSDFVAKLDKNLDRTYEEIILNLKTKREQVMDTRSPNDPSVVEGPNGGMIPGAKHMSFDSLFSEDGTIKSDAELKALFNEAGIDLGQPIVASCLRGITACAGAAAAYILGKDNVPVYVGSWTEYSQRAPDHLKERVKKT